MMLRYALGEPSAADAIENAVKTVIERGLRTGDIYSEGSQRVGTREMGEAIAAAL
jgi:3-isopropylmalate dehydrogenase